MSKNVMKGMALFYGEAGCSRCHSGVLQTDQDFHAIAMPQIGPGKGHGIEGLEDYGREGVSGNPADRYKFRTPSLRNVALTGPWGHDGAFNTLEAVVLHHLNPLWSLYNYDTTQAALPSREDMDAIDFVIQNTEAAVVEIASHSEILGLRFCHKINFRI